MTGAGNRSGGELVTHLGRAALSAIILAMPVTAQGNVELMRQVYVERQDDGSSNRVVALADRLSSGDMVVLVIKWQADGDRGFSVSSPLPATLSYHKSSRDDQLVSVDSGRSFGVLDTLKVRTATGARSATPEDVTHLRWHVPARVARAGSGQLTYSAIVKHTPRRARRFVSR